MIREFSEPGTKRTGKTPAEPGTKRTTKKPRCVRDESPDTGQLPDQQESPPIAMEWIQSTTVDNDPKDSTVALSSYKNFLMGNQATSSIAEEEILDEEDLEFIEGDAIRSTVDDLISIDFLEQVQAMDVKSLNHTAVIKLLG
ncbi:hypothetical protein HRI_003436800 [Hibiscus trionum]|uniref:Uncharacterized protein n=1 Tax=Hibiscus trionum TaxID=183268 RepID=A0A9W7IMB5_HIBTR|nr:hypothetical protein HRI_003436800 [Hibiscus trionum]